MYTVLVALDGTDDRALVQAAAITALPDASNGVKAVLVHVFEDNPEGASVHRLSGTMRAVERLEEAGVTHELRETSGDPAIELLRLAEEIGADAICVSGRQRTRTGKALFGSVTQSILLEADRPVINVAAE